MRKPNNSNRTYAVAQYALDLLVGEEVQNYYMDGQEEECNPENGLEEEGVAPNLWRSP